MATDNRHPIPVRIVIGDAVLTGQLWDHATARDLLTLLPLTLRFRDFNGVEKIARLHRKLSMDGVPAGDDPFPGDIGYYNPSGDLVFHYDDVDYFPGIVRLGSSTDRWKPSPVSPVPSRRASSASDEPHRR